MQGCSLRVCPRACVAPVVSKGTNACGLGGPLAAYLAQNASGWVHLAEVVMSALPRPTPADHVLKVPADDNACVILTPGHVQGARGPQTSFPVKEVQVQLAARRSSKVCSSIVSVTDLVASSLRGLDVWCEAPQSRMVSLPKRGCSTCRLQQARRCTDVARGQVLVPPS